MHAREASISDTPAIKSWTMHALEGLTGFTVLTLGLPGGAPQAALQARYGIQDHPTAQGRALLSRLVSASCRLLIFHAGSRARCCTCNHQCGGSLCAHACTYVPEMVLGTALKALHL